MEMTASPRWEDYDIEYINVSSESPSSSTGGLLTDN
jgi:hypothetical protein